MESELSFQPFDVLLFVSGRRGHWIQNVCLKLSMLAEYPFEVYTSDSIPTVHKGCGPETREKDLDSDGGPSPTN